MDYDIQEMKIPLQEAVTEVFEGMAFAEVEKCEEIDKLPDLTSNDYYATLSITQPFSAGLNLVVDQNFLEEILQTTIDANSPSDFEKMAKDLISESANTIAGCFLNKYLPPEQEFEIGIPASGKMSEKPVLTTGGKKEVIFSFTVEFKTIYCILSGQKAGN
ncbi:MAG: chemotaxis protein CheX [Calditrichia bacterium]